MTQKQMEVLLVALQQITSTTLARDLASLGLTMLRGSEVESAEAWAEIQKMSPKQ